MPHDSADAGLPESLAGDKLKGADRIAAFIDEPVRRTFNLLEQGLLPAGKQGREWLASKRALLQHYRRVTSGETV